MMLAKNTCTERPKGPICECRGSARSQANTYMQKALLLAVQEIVDERFNFSGSQDQSSTNVQRHQQPKKGDPGHNPTRFQQFCSANVFPRPVGVFLCIRQRPASAPRAFENYNTEVLDRFCATVGYGGGALSLCMAVVV